MTRTFKKKSMPLNIAYGIAPAVATKLFTCQDRSTCVDAGWIKLQIGWDEKGSEIVLASTRTNSVLIAAKVPLYVVPKSSKKRVDWVYAIDVLPAGFLHDKLPPNTVFYSDFRVTFGVDHQSRDFLTVAMPGGNITWLFRNPTSKSTAAWSLHRAVAVNDGLVVHPHWNAAVIGLSMRSANPERDELDELLDALG